MGHRNQLLGVLEGKIQGKRKRGRSRNDNITHACIDIAVQTYGELKRKSGRPRNNYFRQACIDIRVQTYGELKS